jgi:hypothetical protein
MIEIFCLGGGAGGAVALVGIGSRAGGNGGGASGIVRGVIPAFLLPNRLYVLVGKGGAGSTTNNTAGGVGGISYIGLQPSTSEQTLICKSSTQTPSNSTAGATISTVALSAFGNLGLFTAIAGVGASAGGAVSPTAGGSQTSLGTSLVTGGGGGGGKTTLAFSSGGSITSASVILTTQVNGGVTDAQKGNDGYGTLIPFCGTGGAGGAGKQGDSGVGGNGGNGFYGCGGGGAGASSTTIGINRGGNGGDGIVIITVIS